ncbi:hypothetical protein [Sorangium sp. So ce1099]|uniref:hypothetical protein n=1 Tax=Sorangium sp. So ce1099 TaxID=3133331 RepID=UPI003F604F8C
MIRVHERQLDEVGRTLALEQFEDEMVVHLRSFVPRHAHVIGEEWLRRSIRFGIVRAAEHGVSNPGLLRFYVELIFMFGSRFDEDPLLPWAGKILRDPGLSDEVSRIERLYQATREYLEATDRLGKSLAIPILRSLKQLSIDKISPAAHDFEQRVLDALVSADPKRCAYLGEPPLRDLARRAHEVAVQHRLAADPGAALVAGLMFFVGHGFAEDPTFPWIDATLHHPSIKDPSSRALRLRRWAELYVEKALQHFERQGHVVV